MSLRAVLTILALVTQVAGANAWNAAGHMVSGAIAYSALKKDSPGTLAQVVTLLKKHPEYESRWADQINADYVAEDERDLYLFMLAARWADDVRRNRTYDRPRWHYINFPIKPEGQPESVQAKPPDPDNILRALQANLDKLKSDSDDAERAVALCWLFHLIGDLHQPLHTVALFTTDYPNGDKGGNLFFIRARDENQAIPLHKLWDDLITGTSRFQTVRNKSIELRLRPDLAAEKLDELKSEGFDKWAAESVKLAKEVAYRQGKLVGSTDKADAPVLPDGYTKEAKAVAERRIVLAGQRLARTVATALNPTSPMAAKSAERDTELVSDQPKVSVDLPQHPASDATKPGSSLAPKLVIVFVGAILVVGALLLWYSLRGERLE